MPIGPISPQLPHLVPFEEKEVPEGAAEEKGMYDLDVEIKETPKSPLPSQFDYTSTCSCARTCSSCGTGRGC